MTELDTKIRQALQAATELPGTVPEPTLTEEIMATFQGRHRLLNISGAVKMICAGLIFYFCVYQFFQQESMMAMLAYATAALLCMAAACTAMLWFWVQINHNETLREVKKLELQIALLTREFQQPDNKQNAKE